MAETTSKRQREETQLENCGEDSKRHKSYNHILSILEDEEDEPNQDLSSFLTTLQQELSCEYSTCHTTESDPENPIPRSTASDYCPSDLLGHVLKEDELEEEERDRVMRHLLEASDDELGIPHSVGHSSDDHDGEINGGDHHAVALFDGLWEFEDEAANYYTLLQFELFM